MNMVRVMVCSVTFNNISAISWQSVLVVEEKRGILRKPQTAPIDALFVKCLKIY